MPLSEVYGSYTLIERLAVGGMAEVFLARSADPALRGRAVVVKRMLPQLAGTPELVTLFLDEARLGALLKHKHIVEVFDVGELGGSWYMALSFIDGPDFAQTLSPRDSGHPSMPGALAAWVIARAAEGLHFAHTMLEPQSGTPLQLVHRDVSPQNILLSRSGGVYVADFGVAKSQHQLHKTHSGQVKGKIAYMSPEQLGGKPLDARTDVLALGVSLWEALARQRMYAGLTDIQVMMRVCTEEPPSFDVVGVDVDPELAAIVRRALARDREVRQASAGALMHELDAWASRQRLPPAQEQLSQWLQQHFAPRAVVENVPTQWTWRGTPPALPAADAEATQIDLVPSPTDADHGVLVRPGDAASAPVDAHGARQRRELASSSAPTDDRDATTIIRDLPAALLATPVSSSPPVGPKKLVPVGRPRPLGRPGTPSSSSPSSSSSAAAPAVPPVLPRRKDLVLYVEDEQQNWEVAELLLQKNFDLLHAADDQSACALLRDRGAELTAVLMDIQLKGSALDGIALVRLLRAGSQAGAPSSSPSSSLPSSSSSSLPSSLSSLSSSLPPYAHGVPRLTVPVFFVTAHSARYGEQELLSVGADKLVTKPVDFAQLTMALTSFQLRRAASLPRDMSSR